MGGLTKSPKGAIAIIVLVAAMTGGASAAVVKVGNLVLRADGGFSPSTLPQKRFVPIDFQGHAEIEARGDGALPPALQQAVIDFDRDGRLGTQGLPSCTVEQVRDATPEQARGVCSNAIVGTGHLAGVVSLPGEPPQAESSLLTIFNGPRWEGNPTVILHAQMLAPSVQTFAILVPIQRRGGLYKYRATIDVPPIAGGYGVLTRVDAKIGKHYFFAGKKRSYTSARCSDGILQAHGHFTFVDGVIIDGSGVQALQHQAGEAMRRRL